MNVTVDMSDFGKISALLSRMRPGGRAQLNRVGANAAAARVQRHVRGYAMGRHATASALGAPKTGHYEKGAAAVTSKSSADGAEVLVPIPGIGRAYHDVVISTPTRNGKKYVTIPKHREAYGQTVEKLRTRGWKIFRPGKSKCLLGYRKKGEKPVMLFALATGVRQERDPRLLPQVPELGRVYADAVRGEIERVMRKAGRK